MFQAVDFRDGFSAPVKLKALEALAEAAANRNLRPAKDTDKLVALIQPAASRSGAGPREGGRPAGGPLEARGGGRTRSRRWPSRRSADEALRGDALDALAAIGGRGGRSQIEALTGPAQPAATRILAVAALARLDVDAAAARAAEILASRPAPARDLTPLLAAFLEPARGRGRPGRQARDATPPPPIPPSWPCEPFTPSGHADPALVAALSRAAGLSAETKAAHAGRAQPARRRGRRPTATLPAAN